MSYRLLFALWVSMSLYVGVSCAAVSASGALDKSLRDLPHRTHANAVVELPGIIYSALNGYRALRVDLFLPTRGKAPYPAVMFLHGGGWTLDPGADDPITGPAVMAKLAANGYVVARATYRLSDEAKFPAALTDAKTCSTPFLVHRRKHNLTWCLNS